MLVGGEGTRLRPLTLSVTEADASDRERPMIERVLAHLGAHGVDEAVLSLQYLPDAFNDAYPDDVAAGVRLDLRGRARAARHGRGGSLRRRRGGIDDTFVVVNGDVLTDLDLGALIGFHRYSGAEGTIRLYPVDDPSRFGVVTTDDEGRVLEFIEKPPRRGRTEQPHQCRHLRLRAPVPRAGCALGERASIERVTFPEMASRGPPVRDGRALVLARHRDPGRVPAGATST